MALLYVFAIEFVAPIGTLRKNAYAWLWVTQPVKLRACALSPTRVQSFSTTYDWHEFVWHSCCRSDHFWPDRLYAVHEPTLSFLPSSFSLIPPTTATPRSLMFPNHSPGRPRCLCDRLCRQRLNCLRRGQVHRKSQEVRVWLQSIELNLVKKFFNPNPNRSEYPHDSKLSPVPVQAC